MPKPVKTVKITRVIGREAAAGYKVKEHGHRFFTKRLKIDAVTNEVYLPAGYKWVQFVALDTEDPTYAFVVVKDEIHG